MTETSAATYKNRRGGLIFFGLVELALGVLCLLFVVLITFSVFLAAARTAGAPPAKQMFVSVLLYLVGGALLVTLGVGSMMARRWARDLSLVVSWLWLILGASTAAAMIFLLPRVMQNLPSDQAGMGTMVLTCMSVFFGLFGIVVPLAMILFYGSPNVRATCLALDPHPRWTERAPLPLLGLSLWTFFSAICITGMSGYAVLPLGRQIVTGPIAVITYCAIGVVLLYVSWGLFARSLVAWWVGLAYGVLVSIYFILAFPHLDYERLTRAMGMPKTPGMPNLAGIYQSPWFLAYIGFFWLFYFGYFLLVFRYFRQDKQVAGF